MTDRRTRIVATLGPATDRPGLLDELLRLGLDVARINFSHGSAEEHVGRIRAFRAAAERSGRLAAVLADLPGPKLRVRLAAACELVSGAEVAFRAAPGDAAAGELAVTEPEYLREVRPGQRILLDDGRLQLRAVRSGADQLVAAVEVGGELAPNKGLNLPDTRLSVPAVTPRDWAALETAASAGVDWLALSFVRGPGAADELRAASRRCGLDGTPVLAKIERPEAVDRAADILAAFDGVMVARGDLGVEIELEKVPTVQKRLIALARSAGKPVVTATDMLDSMRLNPRPTRAEASDVANAIYDGTDALMLSGETAVGRYPVEAVACMDRIAREAESHTARTGELPLASGSTDDRLTLLTCELARETGADAIVTPTLSGRTARLAARHRPRARIVAPAPNAEVLRRMAVVWGTWPVPMAHAAAGADRLAEAVRAAFAAGAVRAGQLVVVLAGHPVEGGARLPTIRLVRVGAGGASVEP
jgi:pyruvate kinase